jgi:hypothetical protein
VGEGKRVRGHLRARARLVGLLVALALVGRLLLPAPPPKTMDGVAQLLGQAAGQVVRSSEFVWEPAGGPWRDALLGRFVLFLGGASEGAARDLYRARVRVSREGRPIAVESVRNLTATPLGDDGELGARGRHAVFATRAFGTLQGITVLDLRGNSLATLRPRERLVARLDNVLDTGSFAGLGRLEVLVARAPAELSLELGDESLLLGLGQPPVAVTVDLGTAELRGSAEELARLSAWTVPQRVRPPSHFLMDAARRLFGTERADRAKAVVFLARSSLVRLVARARSARADVAAPSPEPPGGELDRWPPPTIGSLFRHPLEGEGQWRLAPVSWLPAASPGAEPYLLETMIRPDPELPFAAIRLVAMDTRQLDLRIEAGFDEPRPDTGPPGRGRIPPRTASGEPPRVVAAFNGAFQSQHGAYGMVVDRRVLLAPKPGAATVVVDVHGRTWMGSWGAADTIPPWVQSLRQNLDPLLDEGVLNPRGRTDWGFPLDGGSVLTERSALCLTRGGYLVYGWGMEVGAETLGRALQRVGCRYALHLDMNPGHVGLSYLRIRSDGVDAALLAREMSIAPRRFVEGSPKDFFYLELRDSKPEAALGLDWQPDAGTQPPPSWLPAVHTAELERLGTKVRLQAFARGRLSWQIRPGRKEQAAWTADGPLPPELEARALVAISLGVAYRKDNRRGLVLDGVATLPIRPDLGMLATSATADEIAIGLSVENAVPPGDASELVLLAVGGQLRPEARELGPMRTRTAGCVLEDGSFVVAASRYDSPEANAVALCDLGCHAVVELSRGHQPEAFVHRAGTEPAPRGYYEDTVLYGLSTEARGLGRRLEEHAGAR